MDFKIAKWKRIYCLSRIFGGWLQFLAEESDPFHPDIMTALLHRCLKKWLGFTDFVRLHNCQLSDSLLCALSIKKRFVFKAMAINSARHARLLQADMLSNFNKKKTALSRIRSHLTRRRARDEARSYCERRAMRSCFGKLKSARSSIDEFFPFKVTSYTLGAGKYKMKRALDRLLSWVDAGRLRDNQVREGYQKGGPSSFLLRRHLSKFRHYWEARRSSADSHQKRNSVLSAHCSSKERRSTSAVLEMLRMFVAMIGHLPLFEKLF